MTALLLALLLVYGPVLFLLGERMGRANAVLLHLRTCGQTAAPTWRTEVKVNGTDPEQVRKMAAERSVFRP